MGGKAGEGTPVGVERTHVNGCVRGKQKQKEKQKRTHKLTPTVHADVGVT